MDFGTDSAHIHKETRAQPSPSVDGPLEAAPDAQPRTVLAALGAAAPPATGVGALRGAATPISAIGLLQLQRQAGNAQVAAMLGRRLARTTAAPPPTPGSPAAVQAQLGAGQPLDGAVRSNMESAYGADFSHVRVHTDSVAADLSGGLDAQAFTVGKHVAFGSGAYAPGTPLGDTVIAHELAHTIQQDRSTAADDGPSSEDTHLEADADRAASPAVGSIWSRAAGAVAGVAQRAIPSLTSGLRLQRCSGKTAPPPTVAEKVEFVGSHPMTPFGGDPKVSPVWQPGAADHAVAYTKSANPVVNAVFQVGSLPADASVSSAQVRVKEGGAVRATTTLSGAPTGRVPVNGLALTGLTGSTGVRASAYTLDWEASVDGSTWSPLVSTGTHPIYWLCAAPLTPLRNMAVARATGFANGAADAMAAAVAIRSGLSGAVTYNPSDPINADPLTVFGDGVGICTDFGNLLTLLALSVGLHANAVMFFGGFISQGRNIWVTKAGGYTSLTQIKGSDATKYTPPGWDFSYHVISRIEGSLQDAALNTAGIDAQAFHDGKILHLVELDPGLTPPAGRVGSPFSWQIPRKDHPVAVTVRDYGPQIDVSVFSSDVLPIGVPTGAASPFEVPVHWTLTGGALPAGLTLNPATGLISGTPTAAGKPSLSIQTAYGGTLLAASGVPLSIAPKPPKKPASVP